jgi:hypothetical protein
VVSKPGNSHFWAGLMKVKEKFLQLGVFTVNNGRNVRFWQDKWLGNFTLQDRYPSLYKIVRRKDAAVSSVFSSVPLNISFRRGLYGRNLQLWHRLVMTVVQVRLNKD